MPPTYTVLPTWAIVYTMPLLTSGVFVAGTAFTMFGCTIVDAAAGAALATSAPAIRDRTTGTEARSLNMGGGLQKQTQIRPASCRRDHLR